MCPVRCVTYVSGRSPIKQRLNRITTKIGASGSCYVHLSCTLSPGRCELIDLRDDSLLSIVQEVARPRVFPTGFSGAIYASVAGLAVHASRVRLTPPVMQAAEDLHS